MSIPSNHLDAFMAVAELLNFTKAAESLHITQSALSQRVLNLEADLKVALFIRDRSGLKLTEEAYELVRYCQTRKSLEDEFMEGLKSQNSIDLAGHLRIGGFSSVVRSVIQPSIGKLLQDHKKIRLSLMTREFGDLPDMLKRGEIDYMVLDNRVEREDIERIHLGFEHNVLVQVKKYQGPEIYLDHDANDTVTEEYLKISKKKPKKIERRYLDDVYGLIDGVSSSFGMAILPKHLINTRRDLEIIDPEVILKVPVAIYFYKKQFYSKLHDVALEEIVKNSRKLLSPS